MPRQWHAAHRRAALVQPAPRLHQPQQPWATGGRTILHSSPLAHDPVLANTGQSSVRDSAGRSAPGLLCEAAAGCRGDVAWLHLPATAAGSYCVKCCSGRQWRSERMHCGSAELRKVRTTARGRQAAAEAPARRALPHAQSRLPDAIGASTVGWAWQMGTGRALCQCSRPPPSPPPACAWLDGLLQSCVRLQLSAAWRVRLGLNRDDK